MSRRTSPQLCPSPFIAVASRHHLCRVFSQQQSSSSFPLIDITLYGHCPLVKHTHRDASVGSSPCSGSLQSWRQLGSLNATKNFSRFLYRALASHFGEFNAKVLCTTSYLITEKISCALSCAKVKTIPIMNNNSYS